MTVAKLFELIALKATTVIGSNYPWSSVVRKKFCKKLWDGPCVGAFTNLCAWPFAKTVDGYQNINIPACFRFDWTSEVQLNFLVRFGQNF